MQFLAHRMYCSLMAENSSCPAVSRTASSKSERVFKKFIFILSSRPTV